MIKIVDKIGIYNAIDAQKLAESVDLSKIESIDQMHIDEILMYIQSEAKRGEFRFIFWEWVSEKTKYALKDMGYKITEYRSLDGQGKLKLNTIISWKP